MVLLNRDFSRFGQNLRICRAWISNFETTFSSFSNRLSHLFSYTWTVVDWRLSSFFQKNLSEMLRQSGFFEVVSKIFRTSWNFQEPLSRKVSSIFMANCKPFSRIIWFASLFSSSNPICRFDLPRWVRTILFLVLWAATENLFDFSRSISLPCLPQSSGDLVRRSVKRSVKQINPSRLLNQETEIWIVQRPEPWVIRRSNYSNKETFLYTF